VNTALKDQGKSSRDVIDGFITNIFRLLSVPNKIPDVPNKKASPNGMCPINVKKIDYRS
jgi:hypothetical protein